MNTAAPARLAAFGLVITLSGAVGLAAQLVWSRMLALRLGMEGPAGLAVIFSFLAGLALGAFLLDHRIRCARNAWRSLAVVELTIALWLAASSSLLPVAGSFAAAWIGVDPSPWRHWFFALLVPLVVLLPATAAMGATFPAMERIWSAARPGGASVAPVYSLNTLGALAGTLAGPFVFLPAFGFVATLRLLAGASLVCAVTCWMLSPGPSPPPSGDLTSTAPGSAATSRLPRPLTLFATGLLGIGLEVIALRVLAQTLEGTIYTFASILAVYLLGTSLGAALARRLVPAANMEPPLAPLLLGLAGGTIWLTVSLGFAPRIYEWARAGFGDGAPGVSAAEMALSAVVLWPVTVVMGATFAVLVQSCRDQVGPIGRAVALNTAGGALAAPLFGAVLIPWLGAKISLVLAAGGYLALVPRRRNHRLGLAILAGLSVLLLHPGLRVHPNPPIGKVIQFREGSVATVAVVEEPDGSRVLRVNHRLQMGGTAAAFAQWQGAHVPLLLHPSPRTAAFLGLGTGITFGAASLHPGLRAEGVELVPEVIEVMPAFAPENHSPETLPSLRLHVADARRFIQSSRDHYDVIVADVVHPAVDGSGALYTREHFQAVRDRLAPGGLFCQWLPLHQLDEPTLRLILRTFLDVFPAAQGWLLHLNVNAPVLGLVATTGPAPTAENWVEPRVQGPLAGDLKTLVGSSRVDLQACKLEYSIVSPK